ncbi:MAG: hypothetical protein R2712_11575 [Vicinamibacterales bacterium]
MPVYSKPFRLTRQITILDTPEARKALAGRSSVELAGTLQYQACDDTVCYAPGKVPVSFTITLTRPGAREVAADGGRARPLRPPIPAVRGRRPLSHSTPPQARPH